MDNIRRMITLDEETDKYIKSYMDEHKIRFNGEAIARICKEHKEAKTNEWSLKYITEMVTKNIHDVLKEELTKIRLGSNSADRNTQVLIELMNGLYFHESIEGIITTSVQEMDAVKTAKKEVEDRISHQRQKKIDWEASRNKDSQQNIVNQS